MSMMQKLSDERNKFIENHNKEPDKSTLNFDEGFKLLEELRDMTNEHRPRDAMTRILLSRDEECLIDIFKGSQVFGMLIEIKGAIHEQH